MLEPVLVSGVLLLVGNSFVVSVWKYVGDGLTGNTELAM